MPRSTPWRVHWRALVGSSLLLSSCEGGSANESPTMGAGHVCHDYVTPDGFTCCCGSMFCTLTAGGCERRIDGGSTGGAGGDTATLHTTTTQPVPWTYGDGGVPKSLVFDPSCPSFQLAGFVAVVGNGLPLHEAIEFVTADGCCLPSGLCGGAPPVERVTVDPSFPVANFAGWDPPWKCYRYADLPMSPAGRPKSCQYPVDAGAGSDDATTLGSKRDAAADGD